MKQRFKRLLSVCLLSLCLLSGGCMGYTGYASYRNLGLSQMSPPEQIQEPETPPGPSEGY